MDRDIQAKGPWVLVKVHPPEEKRGSIYLPAGNMEERMGQATATVLSVGQGKWNEKGKKYVPNDVKIGDTVFFRGFLQVCNRPHEFDSEHCLLHIDDILGVFE